MKSLTQSEAVVVRSLLAAEHIPERERIHRSGIPPRTFEAVRKRAYLEGWVFDRYIPDPARVGKPKVSFTLVQPFSESHKSVESRWTHDPGLVLLWSWPETLFAVFIGDEEASRIRQGAFDPGACRNCFDLTADARRPQIPVFFDFEGAWTRSADLPGTQAYPHSLPANLRGADHALRLPTSAESRLAELVSRPFRHPDRSGPLRVSPFFLPRSQQRLLATGAVERRVFPDLTELPPPQNRAIERIVFLRGILLPGMSAPALFRRLARMNVLPFLFATDDTRVLLGALSPAPPTAAGTARPAVLGNVEQFLRNIEIVRERVLDLTVVANHRYDRIFATG
jgi:hypothetical protein